MSTSQNQSLDELTKDRVIAVSKLQSIEKIRALFEKGYRNFGENYVQEALPKVETLKDLPICWHFIGTLQKNKLNQIIGKFEYLHSMESLAQLQALDSKCKVRGHKQKVFLQVNVANENSKSGFLVSELTGQYSQISALSNIEIVGLMTMPPLTENPEDNRIHFKNLAHLARQFGLKELSMGTSHDYKIALEEGATWVRLGTILFGERKRA